jgi:L-ascorbate metabolism protein UlaG (beta-lactamase superfamily)
MSGAALCIGLMLMASTAVEVQSEASMEIRYLGNSGWTVRINDKLMVFDYIPTETIPDAASLHTLLHDGSAVQPDAVYLFVSHAHADHYSTEVFDLDGVYRIFGWNPGHEGVHRVVEPYEEAHLNGIKVAAIESTDIGAGFVVTVDGISIFHAGDHALWTQGSRPLYEREISRVGALVPALHLAFVPVATGRCEATEDVWEGAMHAVAYLEPWHVFPMHVRCPELRGIYQEFATVASERFPASRVRYATAPGDRFSIDRPRSAD